MTVLEQLLIVADQDLHTTELGGGGNDHPEPEMRGTAVSKKIFRPFGLQFGLKIRGGGGAGGPGPSPGSANG